jgi:hypothetical protein
MRNVCDLAHHYSEHELDEPTESMTLLRHSDAKLTLQCYTHSVSEHRMAAAGTMLTAIFSDAAARSGLRVYWEGRTRFRQVL